jgi:hypothetical protein
MMYSYTYLRNDVYMQFNYLLFKILSHPGYFVKIIKMYFMFCFLENDTSTSYGFGNSSTCENASRSIDDFPPDFFTNEQRRHGAVVFHFLVAFYGFVFIAFVCNDYFLPSVFCICLGTCVTHV